MARKTIQDNEQPKGVTTCFKLLLHQSQTPDGCVAKRCSASAKVGDRCIFSLDVQVQLIQMAALRSEIILRCVRWYCTYPLSYRQLAEIVNERGMDVHHTTLFR